MKSLKFIRKAAAFALIAVLVLGLSACGAEKASGEPEQLVLTDGAVLGEGKSALTVEIVHSSGEEKAVTVNTDAETVGEALLSLGIIAGESSSYGLYVKTVDGETLDYDTDGKYWGFYVDGAYAAVGVDQTAAENGVCYSFRAE